MSNENAENSKNDQTPDEVSEAEVLLSRIVDHQATEQDQQRFEELAAVDSSLWRTLAQQQQEMAALSDTVIEQLVAAADGVELPTTKSSITPLKPFAFIGWAAAILIAAVWILLPAREPSRLIPTLTSDQHLDEYRKADFLKQEFDPIMLDWERINDDWIRIYYMRRFEESVLVNRPLEEIIAGDKFIVTPEELRKESPPPPTTNDQ